MEYIDFDPRNFNMSIQKVIDKIKEDYIVSDFDFTVEKIINDAELCRIKFKYINRKP